IISSAVLNHVHRAADDPKVKSIVIIGSGRCFSGGADIRELNDPAKFASPLLSTVIDTIENSAKPVVAAIHGAAFGGGLELAIGCHYRIGMPSARMAQPEVKLGLIPGAGGTQRLPRLIGVEAALEMIVGGEPVSAKEALSSDLIDQIVEGDLKVASIVFAEQLIRQRRPARKTRDRDEKLRKPDDSSALLENTRKGIERKSRGLLAPFLCIDSVANAVRLPFVEGIKQERVMFVRCRNSEQSRAQRHGFFSEGLASKIPDVPANTRTTQISQAAVIGSGTMGAGIAMNFANAGIPVRLLDVSQAALDKGIGTIRNKYAGAVSKGRISAGDMKTCLALIEGASDYIELADVDIAIEAVFEDMALKKEVFTRLDRGCRPGVILATNTSTLNINEIAAVTTRPGKVIGTHFFSPANVMKLVEVVRGENTSKETVATVMRLAKKLGKAGVLVGVCDGFVGNRMYYSYTRQANFLLEEGALPQQVDNVIYKFGFPMGPFAVGDLAGLDIGWRARQHRAKTQPTKQRHSPIADRICELGRFGQKTGAGWYRYQAGNRTPIPDPDIEQLILSISNELAIERRKIDNQEILERCIYSLVNEGAKILEEGLVVRSSDIDVIWLHGYGFPVYRGGPMYYADQVGLRKVYDTMSRLHDRHGEPLKPAALLESLARQGKTFQQASSAQ
ncbi:3-hydroxyacyl-CoA dehydrogenase NAD-binding domain-containing protein, partial [Pseudomonadota bacterium]